MHLWKEIRSLDTYYVDGPPGTTFPANTPFKLRKIDDTQLTGDELETFITTSQSDISSYVDRVTRTGQFHTLYNPNPTSARYYAKIFSIGSNPANFHTL